MGLMGLEGVSRMKEEDGGCCSQLRGGGSVHRVGTENFHLGQLTWVKYCDPILCMT